MTRAERNHNPLNIRKGNNWQGEASVSLDKEFETFINDEYGFRAAFRIIHNGFKAKPPRDTIRKIVNRWAPPIENNTANYISFVSKQTGIDPDTRIVYEHKEIMISIVAAMAFMESGKKYNYITIKAGYEMECR